MRARRPAARPARTLSSVIRCPQCGQENPTGFRFCGACAAPLPAEEPIASEERKLVTVLFTDIAGSTAAAEKLDPEDVRARLAPYYALVRGVLERYGGTVEKFIGDAVVALFGAPLAHEDDSERAVRAALAVREAVQRSTSRTSGSTCTCAPRCIPAKRSSSSAQPPAKGRAWPRATS